MLVEIRKLKITNEGYHREFSLDKIYINSNSVVSIVDYDNARDFLLQEGCEKFLSKNFSLVKINEGSRVDEIIAIGSAEELYSSFNSRDKGLLNG